MATHAQFGSIAPAGPAANGRAPDAGSGSPGPEGTASWSLTAAGMAVIGSAFALLAGGWLMYSPFALGYQSDFATWNDATKTDFWDGFGLAVIALLAFVLTGLGFIGVLRQAGVISARPPRSVPQEYEPAAVNPPSPTQSDELTSVLRPLLEALERDNAEAASRPARPPGDLSPSGPYPTSTAYPANTPYPPSAPYPAGKE